MFVARTEIRWIGKDRRSPRATGGFTLIELVAVIVLVGIMSVVAIPSFNAHDENRQAAAAAQVLQELHYARQVAVGTGLRTWVVIDETAETVSLLQESRATPGLANATALTDPMDGDPYVLALNTGPYVGATIDGVNIAGDTRVGFDFLGRPLDPGTENVLATNGSVTLSGAHVIVIAARTGHVYE